MITYHITKTWVHPINIIFNPHQNTMNLMLLSSFLFNISRHLGLKKVIVRKVTQLQNIVVKISKACVLCVLASTTPCCYILSIRPLCEVEMPPSFLKFAAQEYSAYLKWLFFLLMGLNFPLQPKTLRKLLLYHELQIKVKKKKKSNYKTHFMT